MKKTPDISVIMPLYNVGILVEKAIKSVQSQTIDNWELIVVNDGSTDNSKAIALAASGGDERIRIVDKPNGGLSDARNYGLSIASGHFIHFFDSDDWISSDYYESMLNVIVSSSADIVITGYIIESYTSKDKSGEWVKKINPNCKSALDLSNFISGYFNFAWNKLFRREFLMLNGLKYELGLKLIEDCEFMSRVISFNPTISYCNSCGYRYRNDTRKTLSRFFDLSLINNSGRRIECSKKIINYLSLNEMINNTAIDIIKFNTIRFLIHSLFAYTTAGSYRQKKILVKQIICDKILQLTESSKIKLSTIDSILWKLLKGRHYNIITMLYLIKER